MPINEQILEGVNLMLLGMGMVFCFLTLLVLAMNLMSRLARYLADETGLPVTVSTVPNPTATSSEKDELIAVITAAVRRYRINRR